MKKICAVLLSIALMLSCLPFAFAGQGVEGKWKMSKETLLASLGAVDANEYAYLLDLMTYTMDFKTDGTMIMTLSMMGQEESYTDEWHYTGTNSIYMTIQGSPSNATFRFENGNLILDDGMSEMVLEPMEVTAPTAPATTAQGVEGVWKLSRDTLLAALGAVDASEYASIVDSILYTMDFRADGTMIMTINMFGTEESYTDEWHYTGDNSIYMTMQGEPITMTFTFENGNLILDDGIMPMVLEPVEGASSVPAVSGFTTPTLTTKVDLSGKWDGRGLYNYMLVIAAAAGQDYTSMQSLFDLMNFTLNLNADGTATLDVEAFGTSDTENLNTWSVSGNTLTITGIPFTFTISGDTLTLTPSSLGEPFTMTRIY